MIQANRSHQKQIAEEKEETKDSEKDIRDSIQIVKVHVEESQEVAQDQDDIKEEETDVKRDVEAAEEVAGEEDGDVPTPLVFVDYSQFDSDKEDDATYEQIPPAQGAEARLTHVKVRLTKVPESCICIFQYKDALEEFIAKTSLELAPTQVCAMFGLIIPYHATPLHPGGWEEEPGCAAAAVPPRLPAAQHPQADPAQAPPQENHQVSPQIGDKQPPKA